MGAQDAQIGPRAERLAGSGDDYDANRVRAREHAQRLEQILAHIRIERVGLLGTIEGDGADVIRDFDENAIVRRHQTRSTIMAMPWPTPTHILHKP